MNNMKNREWIADKGLEAMKNRTEKMNLIEKLRAMGFSEQEINYNFSQSDKQLDLDDEKQAPTDKA